mmetsp:Transcript_6968/g.9264  ORF Transcript_6968/g.9264 Transcript_6968/m.9264 type:complete len:973 (+) Transcript_6968:198-3116(+)
MIIRKREQQRLRANSNTSRSHNSNVTMTTAPNDDNDDNNTFNEQQCPPSSISITNPGGGSAPPPPPKNNCGTLQSLLTHYDHGSNSSTATAMDTSGGNTAQQLPNSASNTIIPLTDADDSQDDDKTTNASMRDILGTEYTQRDRSSTLGEFRDRSSTFGSDFDLGFGLYSSPAHEMDTSTSNGIPTVTESTANANATTTALNGVAANPTTTTTTTTSHGGGSSSSAVVSMGGTTTSTTTEDIIFGDSTTAGIDGIPTTIMHHRHQPPSQTSKQSTFSSIAQQQQQHSSSSMLPQCSTQQPPSQQRNGIMNTNSGSRPSSGESSTSGFLSGYFGQSPPPSTANAPSSSSTEQQQHTSSQPIGETTSETTSTTTTATQKIMIPLNQNTNSKSITGGVAHTPPSALGSSYESRHFGKRPRAGSISGRLRSASDLEDMGLIDREQKGIVKDLIISGDDALQMALDRYEMGDTSELEGMIKSGAFNNRSSDVDILGDLDLDFLTVADDFGDSILNSVMNNLSSSSPAPTATASTAAVPSTSSSTNHHVTSSNSTTAAAGSASQRSKSMVIPMKPEMSDTSHPPPTQTVNRASSMPSSLMSHIVSGETTFEDDGIGDLDFNGTFPGGEEFLNLPTEQTDQSQSSAQSQHEPSSTTPSSTSSEAQHHQLGEGRFRANSLAFGSLLEDTTGSSGEGHSMFGQWMDRQPIDGETASTNKKYPPSHKHRTTSNIVGANGGLYILKEGSKMNVGDLTNGISITSKQQEHLSTTSRARGGIGASLEISGAGGINNLNRLEQMAERKREKQEKREQREREKQEKKERDAREKQQKKEKKAAAIKAKQEKKKTEGGSGGTSAGNKTSWDKQGKNPPKEELDEEEERKEVPSGLGIPRSLSDPNLTVGLDSNGLMHVDRPDGWVGAYSPESRKIRIERFMEKRNHRVWTKKVKYDVRKNFADSRLRVKGRFVKKEDELLMRDLMSLT